MTQYSPNIPHSLEDAAHSQRNEVPRPLLRNQEDVVQRRDRKQYHEHDGGFERGMVPEVDEAIWVVDVGAGQFVSRHLGGGGGGRVDESTYRRAEATEQEASRKREEGTTRR
jgi:hypothetical protein